jgi:RNA polymerase sigma factor (sigma-70 family)
MRQHWLTDICRIWSIYLSGKSKNLGRGGERRLIQVDEVGAALDRLLIGDALSELSPEHRAVVRRSYHLGWTTAQIADDVQLPEGTVKSRMHYALRALRLTLQEMSVTR